MRVCVCDVGVKCACVLACALCVPRVDACAIFVMFVCFVCVGTPKLTKFGTRRGGLHDYYYLFVVGVLVTACVLCVESPSSPPRVSPSSPPQYANVARTMLYVLRIACLGLF